MRAQRAIQKCLSAATVVRRCGANMSKRKPIRPQAGQRHIVRLAALSDGKPEFLTDA